MLNHVKSPKAAIMQFFTLKRQTKQQYVVLMWYDVPYIKWTALRLWWEDKRQVSRVRGRGRLAPEPPVTTREEAPAAAPISF